LPIAILFAEDSADNYRYFDAAARDARLRALAMTTRGGGAAAATAARCRHARYGARH
jgi:hypothetical protein